MRAVIQRVQNASVQINHEETRSVGRGLVVFLGIGRQDQPEDAAWLASKIARIRIFPDSNGHPGLSAADADGSLLIVSQFTLMASTRKGHRPSLSPAAPPETARPLYNAFLNHLSDCFDGTIKTGEFGASMQVSLVNDGPFTILIDSLVRE